MQTTTLLRFGLVAPPLFVLVFLIEGATRAGYDPWRHPVSQLSLGPEGWINVTVLVAFGLSMLGFGRGIAGVWSSGVGALWGPLLITAFACSLIIVGVVVDDPALGYPPGAPGTHTVTGLIHSLAGLCLFASLSAACFVVARRFAGDGRGRGWAWYSGLTGVGVAVAFIAAGILFTLDQNGIVSPAPSGLFQRVSLISGCTWITLLAAHLLRGEGDPR